MDREQNIDSSLYFVPLRMTVEDLSCHLGTTGKPVLSLSKERICVFSIIIWVLLILGVSPAGANDTTHPKTFKGSDPKGWHQFQWRMTKQQAAQAGAEPFVDAAGEKQLGLSSVELFPGKTFQVHLGFFSHMGLQSVHVTLTPQPDCAQEVYETFLNDFRERYGKEMETRNLDYPNSRYQSHDWIVGSTKIVLHHGCPKPGKVTATQPTTHIWYEKRRHTEPWNR